MRRLSIYLLLYMVCCLAGLLSRAQTRSLGYFREGEKLYRAGNYEDAAQYFDRYLAGGKAGRSGGMPMAVEKKVKGQRQQDPRQTAVYLLADCYRREHDYVRSEVYYKKACGFSSRAFPECRYWYGVVLRANGKYAEAIEALTQFEKEYTTIGPILTDADKELSGLRFIQEQLAKGKGDGFRLKLQQGGELTSAYAAAVYHDTVVFTGIHGSGSYRNDLYEVAGKDSALLPGARLIPMGDSLHNGLASFSADGKVLCFTRWTRVAGVEHSAIWSCRRTDSGWSSARLFEGVNSAGSNTAQPFLTPDGHYLLFASDRPGGLGGYDLYFAVLDSGMHIVYVRNMGEKINTPGDEQAPYYHASSRTLVFASNGRVGMGGFDLYFSRGNFDLSRWSIPENPGVPINSSRDDSYYFGTDEDNVWNTGYLSSDRETNCCLALYTVTQNNRQTVMGRVVDSATRQPLSDVALVLSDGHHPERTLAVGRTDSMGGYRFDLRNSSRVRLAAEKTGYVPGSGAWVIPMETGNDSLNTGDLLLAAIPLPPAEVRHSHIIGNFPYKRSALPASARYMLDSLCAVLRREPGTVLQIEGYTDGIGGDAYNVRLGQQRVDVCIRYLIRKGIPARQLQGKSFGKCCPLAPDTIDGKDNPAGRELNRRVEYKLIRP